ncbi:hypothetical protein [Actinocrispum wychmicini]|nr:hypothetical protein [Actinocrispum wychmicini]
MALHLILRNAKASVADGWAGVTETTEFASLPEHAEDFDWDTLLDILFQDLDILGLFNAELDGIEDPDAEQNQWIGMGDYRPSAWFELFSDLQPRDGRRPFRR